MIIEMNNRNVTFLVGASHRGKTLRDLVLGAPESQVECFKANAWSEPAAGHDFWKLASADAKEPRSCFPGLAFNGELVDSERFGGKFRLGVFRAEGDCCKDPGSVDGLGLPAFHGARVYVLAQAFFEVAFLRLWCEGLPPASPRGVHTAESCQHACAVEPRYGYAAFDSVSGACDLFASCEQPAGLREGKAKCRAAKFGELLGEDVTTASFYGDTEEERDLSCCMHCRRNPQCEFWFRKTTPEGSLCFLKRKYSGLSECSQCRGNILHGTAEATSGWVVYKSTVPTTTTTTTSGFLPPTSWPAEMALIGFPFVVVYADPPHVQRSPELNASGKGYVEFTVVCREAMERVGFSVEMLLAECRRARSHPRAVSTWLR